MNQVTASIETEQEMRSVRQWSWANILFFLATTGIALVGAPLYLLRNGLPGVVLFLSVFYVAATGMSITVGYHRLFAHRTFKAHPLLEFLVLFFGAAAFEQSALRWASQHRDHHLYVDTERDPYSIKKGFFYAHIGWLMFWKHPYHYQNAADLQKNKRVRHQHQYYLLWAIGAGILLPLLIGAAAGHLGGALIFTICLRLTLVYHSTFCINSVCHMFGKATYDIHSTAKDHWLVALLTFGEGYHNFHHRFPSDYRNAVKWYQWDPSKWAIFMLKCVGLARDLRRVSRFRILHAQIAAQNQQVCEWITAKGNLPHLRGIRLKLEGCYEEVRQTLIQWEQAAKNYRAAVSHYIDSSKSDLRTAAFIQLETAKRRFRESQKKWNSFSLNPLGLAF